MIKDDIDASGSLTIVLKGPDGKVKDQRKIFNLVVTIGLGFIASRMKDATATAMSHMAVGTDNTAAGLAQTTLIAETARVALSATTVLTNTITYDATYPAGTGTGALVEAGIFNATPAGTMLSRTVFSVVNKGALDTMTISWVITVN